MYIKVADKPWKQQIHWTCWLDVQYMNFVSSPQLKTKKEKGGQILKLKKNAYRIRCLKWNDTFKKHYQNKDVWMYNCIKNKNADGSYNKIDKNKNADVSSNKIDKNKNADVSSNKIDQLIYFKISTWVRYLWETFGSSCENQSLHLIKHIFDKCIAHVFHTETRGKNSGVENS